MDVPKRIFTVEEANQLLPQIDAILARVEEKKSAIARAHDELLMEELILEKASSGGVYDPGRRLEREAQTLESSFEEIKKEIEQIRRLGCLLRNAEKGWVDFPSEQDGNPVYLCWRRGEKVIGYYHPASGASASRLPLT